MTSDAAQSFRPSALTARPAWKALEAHSRTMRRVHLRQLFAEDARRGERFAVEAAGFYLDYSKNRITDETIGLLAQLAQECGLQQRIAAMFGGQKINVTEDPRRYLHARGRCRARSFVQAYGSTQMDASLLMLPIVGFLPPGDKRIKATVRQIEKHLLVDGLLLRYETASGVDGLPPGEGLFLPCSFWLVDNYVLMGRRREAVRLFERLLKCRNDVGLLAEEYDPRTRRLLGNFPQAFSHVALVNSALGLLHATRVKERPHLQQRHQKSAAPAHGTIE